MIQLDGVDYTVNDAITNAQEACNYINNYCAEHNVVNTHGEPVFIEANMANPLYLILFGFGYLLSIIQSLLYNLGTARSISASTPRQLLEIGEEMKVRLKPATKTVIDARVYGVCTITTNNTVTVKVAGKNTTFRPLFDVTSTTDAPIVLSTETPGALTIPAGYLTFDQEIPGLTSCYMRAATPGRLPETIPQLRERMQRRVFQSSSFDRCQEAILSLPGIYSCYIYFNEDYATTKTWGNVVVPPRRTALWILGYNDDVAETYWGYLSVLTVASPESIPQSFTTMSGQVLTVNMIPPVEVLVTIEVWCDVKLSDVDKMAIRESIQHELIYKNIAARITAAEVMATVASNYIVAGALIEGQSSYQAPSDSIMVATQDSLVIRGVGEP